MHQRRRWPPTAWRCRLTVPRVVRSNAYDSAYGLILTLEVALLKTTSRRGSSSVELTTSVPLGEPKARVVPSELDSTVLVLEATLGRNVPVFAGSAGIVVAGGSGGVTGIRIFVPSGRSLGTVSITAGGTAPPPTYGAASLTRQ